jgi:hypothetical protein
MEVCVSVKLGITARLVSTRLALRVATGAELAAVKASALALKSTTAMHARTLGAHAIAVPKALAAQMAPAPALGDTKVPTVVVSTLHAQKTALSRVSVPIASAIALRAGVARLVMNRSVRTACMAHAAWAGVIVMLGGKVCAAQTSHAHYSIARAMVHALVDNATVPIFGPAQTALSSSALQTVQATVCATLAQVAAGASVGMMETIAQSVFAPLHARIQEYALQASVPVCQVHS